jgi:hypothetical protein
MDMLVTKYTEREVRLVNYCPMNKNIYISIQTFHIFHDIKYNDLCVLTFPLEDCSEFGNFVITLIHYVLCDSKFQLLQSREIQIHDFQTHANTGSLQKE